MYALQVAFIFGFAMGLVGWLLAGPAKGLEAGLAAGLTPWAVLTVVAVLVRFRHRSEHPVTWMRFLDDARARHVLRTAGAVYEFRHARLQDLLAKRATPTRMPAGSMPTQEQHPSAAPVARADPSPTAR
jgi:hypothetical protein